MINYYVRPDGAHVKVDTETKVITNVLDIPVQKTISQITSVEYYDRIAPELESWTVSDETAYSAAFAAVKAAIPGL